MNAFNAQITNILLAAAIAELITLIAFCWLMYVITKLAIRDGIKESGLIKAIERSRTDESTKPMHLPEMRAD